jgi:hypothetical protein
MLLQQVVKYRSSATISVLSTLMPEPHKKIISFILNILKQNSIKSASEFPSAGDRLVEHSTIWSKQNARPPGLSQPTKLPVKKDIKDIRD